MKEKVLFRSLPYREQKYKTEVLTFAFFRLRLSDWWRLRRRLRRGRGCRDLLGNSDSSGSSRRRNSSGVAFERVIGTEFPPLDPQDGHHF